ncbi:hypothetical protein B9479_006243 [Cryptococcus floricola]|uniref:Uncharacterized protein n=1 Tax=Cryptococcus floricola TaxID=2591691 RepID=A0A5D3ASE8_9TREE|nr:hypothetical protein B9479_006243 [Cryptococcus floricola]
MPKSTPADSNASKDTQSVVVHRKKGRCDTLEKRVINLPTQSTVFPPDSRVSGVYSNDDEHMCYCPVHLQPGESDEPSWTGGKPIINKESNSARIHFRDRESTIFEFLCAGTAIITSFRDDDPADDEVLVGSTVTKSDLDEMGLWPTYRDGFKNATGVETGLLIRGEFVNMYEGDPMLEIDREVMTDRETFADAFGAFFDSNTIKKLSRNNYSQKQLEW